MKPFFFMIVLFVCIKAGAQNWHSLNRGIGNTCRTLFADSTDNYLYVSGRFAEVDGKNIKGIARWNGLFWDSLSAGLDGLDTVNQFPFGFASSIVKYNNELYVCGEFNSLGNVNASHIGKWNGSSWDSLIIQPKFHINSGPSTMAVYNGELYVVGYFDSIGGIPANSIAKWDGQNWISLGFPNFFPSLQYVYSEIQSICFYNGKIYVGGVIYSSPVDTVFNIMSFDGSVWQSVSGGIKGNIAGINSMITYQNELYVAGIFTQSNGNIGNNIQKWNDSIWEDVGGGTLGLGGGNGQIFDLFVYNDMLFAVGVFMNAGNVIADRIASWDGIKWCGYGSEFNNTITNLTVYKDSLYIGGGFNIIDSDSINYIAKWIGGNYTDSCQVVRIEELDIGQQISIFPSPALNELKVYSDKYSFNHIRISDVTGKIIFSEKSSCSNCQIDISIIKSGLYFLDIETNAGRVIRVFIKE